MESDRKAAPASIRAIIAEVRVAPIKLSVKVRHEREPCVAASKSPPITPNAAASVAVANPRYMDPMTMVIRIMTGSRKREFLTFWAKVKLGSVAGFHWDDI